MKNRQSVTLNYIVECRFYETFVGQLFTVFISETQKNNSRTIIERENIFYIVMQMKMIILVSLEIFFLRMNA